MGAPDLLVETLKIVSQDGEWCASSSSRETGTQRSKDHRVGTGEEVVETVECFANTVSEEACL